MAPTPSLKVSKTFMFRGAPRIFTNRYHFNGGVPADDAAWGTFMDAVVAAEVAIFKAETEIVQVDGYDAGSDLPVFTKAYTSDGTGTFFAAVETPGQDAALIRYSTTARSTKNHPIYLYNYYHECYSDGAHTADDLDPDQLGAMETYADAWMAGFSDGTNTYVRAGPNGATAEARLVHPFITHRDFRLRT